MNYKDKYPKNLELKKESILIFKRRLYTFQLLSKKKKKKKKIKTKLFDAFTFSVICMLHSFGQ